MQPDGTLLLTRRDVASLLTLEECIDAVERVFRWQGEGKVSAPGIIGVKAPHGGLHVKAGVLETDRNYLVAKLNTNFTGNRQRFGLPTIQGVIVVADGENGYPLAIMDSIDVTVKRTAAASAVAAKYLARPDSSVATICGCGTQGRAQLRAMQRIFPLRKIHAFDADEDAARNFATLLADELKLDIAPVSDLDHAIRQSDICVTCTPSRHFFCDEKLSRRALSLPRSEQTMKTNRRSIRHCWPQAQLSQTTLINAAPLVTSITRSPSI